MYIAYKIIERNAVSNTTKLKVIFYRRDQMLLVIIFHFIICNKSFKRNIEKKEEKSRFCKGFFRKNKFFYQISNELCWKNSPSPQVMMIAYEIGDFGPL